MLPKYFNKRFKVVTENSFLIIIFIFLSCKQSNHMQSLTKFCRKYLNVINVSTLIVCYLPLKKSVALHMDKIEYSLHAHGYFVQNVVNSCQVILKKSHNML